VRPYPRRLLPAFHRQGRALCRVRCAGSCVRKAPKPWQRPQRGTAFQDARRAARWRLFLARSFQRPRDLLPDDRAGLRRVRRGRPTCRRLIKTCWRSWSRSCRRTSRVPTPAERALSVAALCVGGMVGSAQRSRSCPGPRTGARPHTGRRKLC
jgi:hypothetical protein